MKLRSLIKQMPKRIVLGAATLLALIALSLQSVLAADIRLEGSIGVRNITVDSSSNNQYQENTNATYDQVVEFRVFYHNLELSDSGKIAENVRVKVDFPTASGKSQIVKATIRGDNTNTIVDTVAVNLDRDDARIEFIPGSVKWDHNPGARTDSRITQAIADSKILNGEALENQKPCYEYQAYVRFQARVIVPSVGVYKTVRETPPEGSPKPAMQQSINSTAGKQLDYVVSTKNLSNANLTNVNLRDQLPAGVTYVAGSARKTFGEYSSTPMNDTEVEAFFNTKKNVGTLMPGATAYITFKATIVDASKLACGINTIKNIAVVDTDQTGPYNNNATVTVTKECQPQQPVYRCDALTVTKTNSREINASLKYTASNGATFKDVTYEWGDGNTLLTDKTTNVAHTYAKDGEYAITANLRFNLGSTVKSETCAARVNFNTPVTPEVPEELPKTGIGSAAGLFAVTSAFGAAAYQFVARRKRN